MARKRTRGGAFRAIARRILKIVAAAIAAYYILCAVLLLLYNLISPPITGVQMQRGVEYLFSGEGIVFSYDPVPASRISSHLRHAVVAAEDGRFHEHWGVDWQALQEAVEDNKERGEVYRGGSTITQQLVKNLFMTTHSSFVRKAFEVPLTFMAELLLPKERILTLYLNVIEWDRGVYGAEAAARHYYGASAATLTRSQSAALAAVIPNPRERTPSRMGWYRDIILQRMRQMGY